MSSHTLQADDDTTSFPDSGGWSTHSSSDALIPEKKSFSPRVSVKYRRSLPSIRGCNIDFEDLPALKPLSPILPAANPAWKLDSSLLLPPRPTSCPAPHPAPSSNANSVVIKKAFLSSPVKPATSFITQYSKCPKLLPYQYPEHQLQPDPSRLPAATRPTPRPSYLRTARDRTTAAYGPDHPVMNIVRPPPPPSPQDIHVQRARFAQPKIDPTDSPLELVYNIQSEKFSLEHRGTFPPQTKTPNIELERDGPPLLVDGRMIIIELPRWQKTMVLFYRTCDGNNTKVIKKDIELPAWVWMARMLGKREWKDCWIRGV